MLKKILKDHSFNNYLVLFSIISTLFYGIVKTFSFLKFNTPFGDENSFLVVFNSIKKIGFFETWQTGNFSPVFFLVVQPLDYIIDNSLLAARIVSFIALILSILLLYRFGKHYLKLTGIYLFSALVFIASFFFYRIYWQGINDTLFHLIIILSLFCCYNIHFKKKTFKNLILLGFLIGLLIGTRFIALLVIPGYIFFLYKNIKHIFITGIVAFFVGIMLHMPSILAKQKLSSVNKNPSTGITWAQKNYLSQQYIYAGKLQDNVGLTFRQLQNYIDENGADNLPYTFTESILYNPAWTVREFFNDFWYSLQKGYWKTFGLGLLLLIWFTYYGIKKAKLFTENLKFTYNFLLFFWLHTAFISLVVLIKIEFRWYSAFIYLAILFFHQIVEYFKPLFDAANRKLFINLNLILLIGFHFQYIFLDYNPLSACIRKTLRVYFKS